MRRPPRRFPCTRRPVSSEAPGRGDSPARHERRKPRRGHSPLRRSPFPSVSSSSSSFVSCGFPRSFRLLLQLRGSAPGAASPGRLFDSPSIGFKSVKIMFGLSLCSGAAPAASVIPSGFVFACLRPALSRRLPSSVQVRMAGFPPSAIPVYHPVPASCSARLLFVSFMVRISGSFCCSVQFSRLQFRPSCLVHFRSFSFVSVSFCRFVLSSFLRVVPAHRRFYYIFLAYIIHYWG